MALERSFLGCNELPPEFQWLRTPYPERLFGFTGDALRLFGRESVGSWFEQSLVARRQEDQAFRASTRIRFAPDNYQQAAGLVHYYNRHKFHFLAITWHETLGRVLSILSCPGDWPDGRLTFPLSPPLALPAEGAVELAAEVSGARLQFKARWAPGWQDVGPVLDASVISDEGGRGEHGSFTGAFIGMLAFDTSGAAKAADFEHFHYQPE
jgi:xylan 1,4-beta-xylosidase